MSDQPSMIRYFCVTDEGSPQPGMAALSLAFADAFATLGIPFRIIAIEAMAGGFGRDLGGAGAWAAHRDRFLTPMTSPYTNIVCGGPDAWRRLYTVGVRNVLITCDMPDAHKDGVRWAKQYETLIVTSDELAERWTLVGAQPVVVPLDAVAAAARLRAAILA